MLLSHVLRVYILSGPVGKEEVGNYSVVARTVTDE